jgi:hypothetical protein
MFLGGLGLIGWGTQQFTKAASAETSMDKWLQDTGQLYHDRCLEYYGPDGTVYKANPYLYDYGIPNEAQQIKEQKECFDYYLSNAMENRNSMIETNRNEGTGKIVGGSLLALFASGTVNKDLSFLRKQARVITTIV